MKAKKPGGKIGAMIDRLILANSKYAETWMEVPGKGVYASPETEKVRSHAEDQCNRITQAIAAELVSGIRAVKHRGITAGHYIFIQKGGFNIRVATPTLTGPKNWDFTDMFEKIGSIDPTENLYYLLSKWDVESKFSKLAREKTGYAFREDWTGSPESDF